MKYTDRATRDHDRSSMVPGVSFHSVVRLHISSIGRLLGHATLLQDEYVWKGRHGRAGPFVLTFQSNITHDVRAMLVLPDTIVRQFSVGASGCGGMWPEMGEWW